MFLKENKRARKILRNLHDNYVIGVSRDKQTVGVYSLKTGNEFQAEQLFRTKQDPENAAELISTLTNLGTLASRPGYSQDMSFYALVDEWHPQESQWVPYTFTPDTNHRTRLQHYLNGF